MREVFFGNEYRLPDKFAPDDLVMDLGANIGSFVLACLERGAKHIWCYEPDRDNFVQLTKNLQDNLPRWPDADIQLSQAAVWGSHEAVRRRRFHRPADWATACSRIVLDGDEGTRTDYWVDTVSFDDEVNAIVERHKITGIVEQKRIRFCKIDVEGAECAIIPSSKVLHLIDEIALEYHGDVWKPLQGFLMETDFSVKVDQRNNPDIPGNVQGLIFGHRRTGLGEVFYGEEKPIEIQPNSEIVDATDTPKWPREIVPGGLKVEVTHGSPV